MRRVILAVCVAALTSLIACSAQAASVYLGVRLTDVTREAADKLRIPPRGALVTELLDVTGTLIGLEVGDAIVKFDYWDIASLHDLQRMLQSSRSPTP
jgi:S1-C subfamily serine protease